MQLPESILDFNAYNLDLPLQNVEGLFQVSFQLDFELGQVFIVGLAVVLESLVERVKLIGGDFLSHLLDYWLHLVFNLRNKLYFLHLSHPSLDLLAAHLQRTAWFPLVTCLEGTLDPLVVNRLGTGGGGVELVDGDGHLGGVSQCRVNHCLRQFFFFVEHDLSFSLKCPQLVLAGSLP